MNRAVDRVATLCVATFCAVALASCAPALHVETDFDRGTKFRDYHEWSFIDSPSGRGGSLGGLDPTLRTLVEDVIRGELTSRKFTSAESGAADFYVAYHGGAQDRTTVDTYGYTSGWWEARGGDVYLVGANQRTVTEGTLVLDIVDAKSRALVWRGMAKGVVADPAEAAEKATKAVRRMLDNFPPRGS